MKKFFAPFFAILFMSFLISFQGCKKDESSPVTPTTGTTSIGTLSFSPTGIILGNPTQVTVRLTVPASVKLQDSSVKLIKLDVDNKPAGDVGFLYDNGKLPNGDEIAGDNIFSGIFTFTGTTVGELKLRADAKVVSGNQSNDASTSATSLNVLSELTAGQYSEVVNTQATAADKVGQFLAGNVQNMPTAISQTIDWLKTQTGVESAESNGSTSIRIKYKSGLYGGMIVSVENASGQITTKGGYQVNDDRYKTKSLPVHKQTTGTYFTPSRALSKTSKINADLDPKVIGNRNVLIYAPFETYFPVDMRPTLVNILNNTDFEFDITTYIDQNATVAVLENMTAYGLVIFDTHGSGGKEFGTGEIVDTNSTVYKNKYKAMLKEGKLAIWKNVTISVTGGVKNKQDLYAIRAPFISELAGKFPNSVIFNGSCESTMAPDLENAFIGKGAKTYYGFNKVVNVTFCALAADSAVKRLAKDLKNTGEAFIGGSDPQSPNAVYEIKGKEEKNDIHYPDDLINGDFEFGKIDGWTKSGDGRVISQLASVNPTGGSYMGIISTGLGYTTATGKIFQTFTVKNTESTLTIKWNFLSEEFLEYIGSSFQDYFRVTIKTEDGTENVLISKTIDGIASQFGATKEPPNPGNLISVSPGIVFDRGGVYMTNWQTSTFDLTAYRGKRITLTLGAGDVGDSIYDTAILLDDIGIK